MIRTRINLLPKLCAVLAIALMLHTQGAWACSNLSGDHEVPAPCCEEHSSMASDRMLECDTPSSEALCAKPIVHSTNSLLFQVHGDSHDDDLDIGDDGGGSSLTPVALHAHYPAFTDAHRTSRIASHYETLAPARFTYLTTLRLRI